MGQTKKAVKWYQWAALPLFVISVGWMVYDMFYLSPKAKVVMQRLEEELKLINPYPQASLIHSQDSYKGRQALVSRRYYTPATYEELHKYYDTEFASHGWRSVSERKVYNYGRDSGGKTAHYCKGEFSADIEYMGRDDAGTGDYALSLSWGLERCN